MNARADCHEARTRDQLIDLVHAGSTPRYLFFWGHREHTRLTKSCFSQWYPSRFVVDGKNFATAEHYMMYQKAMLFGDVAAALRVIAARSPGEAKAIGRQVLGFEQACWEANCFEIVVRGNFAKFSQNKALGDFLIGTGSQVLVEASPVDPIWGIGLAADNPAAEMPQSWQGLNLLGFALMEVRACLAHSGALIPHHAESPLTK